MGPLIPVLVVSPIFGCFAYFFVDVSVVGGISLFSSLFILSAIGIPIHYVCHFSSFARNDPDRLQSEQFRTEMQQMHMQLLTGKDFPEALTGDVLDDPTPNPLTLEGGITTEDTLSAPQAKDERS